MLLNTTPTPNVIFDEWLPELTKGELKVLLVITRQTFGWVEANETTGRKQKDWISQGQFRKKTGMGTNAIVEGVDGLVKKKMIEVIDEEGNLLDTKQKRQVIGRKRKRLFYRLKFRKQTTVVSKNNQLLVSKAKTTKKTLITKETLTKEVSLIINHLNQKTGKNFSDQTPETVKLIGERLGEGRAVEDLQKVIDAKVADWGKEPENEQRDMRKYLRPKTLFNRANFENYINEFSRKNNGVPCLEMKMTREERFEQNDINMKGFLSRKKDVKTGKELLEKFTVLIGTVFNREYAEEVLSGKRQIQLEKV